MTYELETLNKNKTWSIIDLPPHVKPIGPSGFSKLSRKLMVQ